MSQKRQKLYLIPTLVVGVFILVFLLSWIDIGEGPITQRFDAPIHDRIFRIRNSIFPQQPISSDVTLVGIDDYCSRKLGRFGTGKWLTRAPFLTQIEYFQNIYNPKVLAYDLIFSEFEGEVEANQPEELSEKFLDNIINELNDFSKGKISELQSNTLVEIAKLTSVQGNYNLASTLSGLINDATDKTRTIVAYVCSRPEESISVDKKWPLESILGSDPTDYSEDNGIHIPYLRDVSIPLKYVKNLSKDYKFSKYATIPTSTLLDYATLGYINGPRDEGGVVRRIPLIQGMEIDYVHPNTGEKINHKFFLPSMALLSCLTFWGINMVEMNMNNLFEIDGKPIIEIIWGKHLSIRKPSGEQTKIPIDDKGNFFLDFVGWVDDFNTVSFADVGPFRASNQAKGILSNKIALIGITATGASDVGPTPIHDNTPFVFVHMIAISNILTETFISPTKKSESLVILFAIIAIILPTTLFFKPLRLSYSIIFLVVLYLAIIFYNVFLHKALLPIVGPFLLLFGSYLIVVLYYYFSEEKEKKKIRGMFSTMVSGQVLEYLEDNPESFSLAGRKAEATMFFSDVAGFTSISESLSPEKLVELLNRYLSPMTEIIQESSGYVDKYEGDLIMAEWGIPYPIQDHAKLACWAALDQQEKLRELKPIFIQEFGIEIDVRMGINSGLVSAGNMGSQKRFSYTVMGDPVNQAARFEPANKDYGTLIMIGQSTYEMAKEHIEARLLDKIIVKGKTEPIQIYELIAKKGALSATRQEGLKYYHEGLFYQWERKWDKSILSFKKAMEAIPNDLASMLMINRVEAYKISPPPEGWNGEYSRLTKD